MVLDKGYSIRTVVVQSGAVLNIDVVDGNGNPVPQHDVYLEDAVALSPLTYRPARTNQQGRATFDRLGAGRYRVRTRTINRCNGLQQLSIARVIVVAGNGALLTRSIVGGPATLRLMSPYGPMRGTADTITPGAPITAPALAARAVGVRSVRRAATHAAGVAGRMRRSD